MSHIQPVRYPNSENVALIVVLSAEYVRCDDGDRMGAGPSMEMARLDLEVDKTAMLADLMQLPSQDEEVMEEVRAEVSLSEI
jgi:hypothetical protein